MPNISTQKPGPNRTAWALFRAARLNPPPRAYFANHGIAKPPPSVMALRSDQLSKFGVADGGAALVAPIVGEWGVQGAHITFLTADGLSIRPDVPQSFHGQLRGGWVMLPSNQQKRGIETLIVTKTITDAAALSQLTGYSAIATLSARNMATIRPPKCANLIIAPDTSKTCIKAAQDLAHRMTDLGCPVQLASLDDREDSWSKAARSVRSNSKRTDLLRNQIVSADKFVPGNEIRALRAADFVRVEFPPQVQLLGPWLRSRSLAMIHGQRGSMKTWLGLSIGHAVATGTSLLGWTAPRPKRVLYIDGELPGALVQDRLNMLAGGHDRSGLDLLSPDLLEQRNQQIPDLGQEAGRDAFDAIIAKPNYDLVILDSISTLDRSGIENDAGSWRQIQAWAMRHRSRGRAILFLHHEGRNNKPRGSSKREDVLDIMIGIKPLPANLDKTSTALEQRFTKYRSIYGADVRPRIFRLSTHGGKVSWTSEDLPPTQLEQVQALQNQGLTQSQIASHLNLSAGRISQIKKRDAQ